MNEETYKDLKLVIYHAKHFFNEKYASEHLVHKAVESVEGWIEEVAKEYNE